MPEDATPPAPPAPTARPATFATQGPALPPSRSVPAPRTTTAPPVSRAPAAPATAATPTAALAACAFTTLPCGATDCEADSGACIYPNPRHRLRPGPRAAMRASRPTPRTATAQPMRRRPRPHRLRPSTRAAPTPPARRAVTRTAAAPPEVPATSPTTCAARRACIPAARPPWTASPATTTRSAGRHRRRPALPDHHPRHAGSSTPSSCGTSPSTQPWTAAPRAVARPTHRDPTDRPRWGAGSQRARNRPFRPRLSVFPSLTPANTVPFVAPPPLYHWTSFEQ